MTSSGRKHHCSQQSVFLLSRWRRTFSPSCFVFLREWAELQGGRCLAGGARSRPEEGAGHLAEAPPRPRQPLPATTPSHPGGVRGHHRAALQRPQSAVGGSEFRTPPPTTTTRGGTLTLLVSFMVPWCPADGACEDAADGCQAQQEDTEPPPPC